MPPFKFGLNSAQVYSSGSIAWSPALDAAAACAFLANPQHDGGCVARRATLSDLLHGKASLTPEMALRIEKAFGPDMDHLLRMQLAYDVAKTREHARGISIKRYAPA